MHLYLQISEHPVLAAYSPPFEGHGSPSLPVFPLSVHCAAPCYYMCNQWLVYVYRDIILSQPGQHYCSAAIKGVSYLLFSVKIAAEAESCDFLFIFYHLVKSLLVLT